MKLDTKEEKQVFIVAYNTAKSNEEVSKHPARRRKRP